jgi:anaplastic lymphoma kinase
MPGPQADHLNDANGHFLHLLLTPDTGTRILKSPIFQSSREKCYLEVFMHQSSLSRGSVRIVIEPVEAKESSWVSFVVDTILLVGFQLSNGDSMMFVLVLRSRWK